jgi:hypothetical protein
MLMVMLLLLPRVAVWPQLLFQCVFVLMFVCVCDFAVAQLQASLLPSLSLWQHCPPPHSVSLQTPPPPLLSRFFSLYRRVWRSCCGRQPTGAGERACSTHTLTHTHMEIFVRGLVCVCMECVCVCVCAQTTSVRLCVLLL